MKCVLVLTSQRAWLTGRLFFVLISPDTDISYWVCSKCLREMTLCNIFSFRPVAVGQTCGQLRRPVLVRDQRGNCFHVPLQLGRSALLPPQHRHPEARAPALDHPDPTARQRRPRWDWVGILWKCPGWTTAVRCVMRMKSGFAERLSAPQLRGCVRACENSAKLLHIRKGLVRGIVLPQCSPRKLAKRFFSQNICPKCFDVSPATRAEELGVVCLWSKSSSEGTRLKKWNLVHKHFECFFFFCCESSEWW